MTVRLDFTIDRRSLDDVMRRLDKAKLHNAGTAGFRRGARELEGELKPITPVITGHLRSRWTHRVSGRDLAHLVALVGNRAVYASSAFGFKRDDTELPGPKRSKNRAKLLQTLKKESPRITAIVLSEIRRQVLEGRA